MDKERKTIGFIGLATWARQMATGLLKAGFASAFTSHAEKAQPYWSRERPRARRPRRRPGASWTMLTDDAQSRT